MKIVLFGATGSLGIHLLQQALEKGYKVWALVRDPQKLAAFRHNNLQIIKGNVFNYQDVEAIIKDKDAVLCTLGDGARGKVRAAGTNNIIRAMTALGVKRLVCQTTLGLGDSRDNLNFFWRRIMFGFLIKKAFLDHQDQEALVKKSQLNYTIVRPSAFTDKNPGGKCHVGLDGNFKPPKLKILRSEVASFMLKQLETDRWSRKTVSLSN